MTATRGILAAGITVLCVLATGCANLRPDIHHQPMKEELVAAGAAQYTGPDNGTLGAYYVYTDQLAAWHQGRADGLFAGNALLSELGFIGVVAGVAAAAAEHTTAARNAAIVAGGSTLIADRYSIKVQGANYEKAADAFICMRDKIGAAITEVSGGDIRASSLDVRLPNIVKDNVLAVLRKLRKAQRDIVIAAPDVQKIKEALGLKPAGTVKAAGAAATPNIDELEKNLITCAATF